MHEQNCFITLTYSDDNLPTDYSVDLRTLQLFFKKLRKSLPQKIRYFAVGEYGDESLRPHYHALVFNHDWPDKKLYPRAEGKAPLFTSETLTELWGLGNCWSGSVTYQSAGYCARYAMKKITGDRATENYARIHPLTLQAVTVQPEFAVQSRRPGVGDSWFQKYKSDAFPSDFLVVDGKMQTVPRYYTRKLHTEVDDDKNRKLTDKTELEKVKAKRLHRSAGRKADNTPERLRVREEVKTSRLKLLKREL